MQINTKYYLGDEVYAVLESKYDNHVEIIKGTVDEIIIGYNKEGLIITEYMIKGVYETLNDNNLVLKSDVEGLYNLVKNNTEMDIDGQ